jgi:hypothetical protein
LFAGRTDRAVQVQGNPDLTETFFTTFFTPGNLDGLTYDKAVIKPYFKQGMMTGYIRTGGNDLTEEPNYNHGLNVNRAFVSLPYSADPTQNAQLMVTSSVQSWHPHLP